MSKYANYLLDKICQLRNDEEGGNEFLIGELILVLANYIKAEKAEGVLNEHTDYLLNVIDEYKNDVTESQEEENINQEVIQELVQALAEYQEFIKDGEK